MNLTPTSFTYETKPVLTVDIVGFSTMGNEEQMKAIKLLIRMLNEAIPEQHNMRGRRIWSPAGDGGALTFWEDIPAALDTALTLGRKVNEHNAKEKPARLFQLHIGIHSGTVTKEVDFDDRENIWGEGMNISARVASLAKPGQIVASLEYIKAADLERRSKKVYVKGAETERWPKLEVVSIGKWWAKHHKSIELYNLYVEGPDGAGIPASEVDVWYGPFHYPLQQAIGTYEAMLEEQTATREPGFRVAVLAKRLLDLDPKNSKARETLEAISARSFGRRRELEHLYDKFLSPLTPSALNYFFSNATFKAFQKDEIVVKEGDPANSMMMVVSGEIGLSIKMKGKPLHELAEHSQPEDRGLTFQEGAIIGEMGLFSPGGRRTATVKALRNTIMLTLDYSFLKLDAPIDTSSTVPPRVMNIVQIRNRIWEYYCQRMIQNQISSHPLFQRLSNSEANQLAETGQFLPTDYGKPVELKGDDIWRFWIVVVSGGLTVSMSRGGKTIHVKYGPGECLGPIRLSVAEDPFAPDAPNPFSGVAVDANTQVILFRWSRIKDLIENEELRDFRQDCILSGGVDRLRYRFADSK